MQQASSAFAIGISAISEIHPMMTSRRLVSKNVAYITIPKSQPS